METLLEKFDYESIVAGIPAREVDRALSGKRAAAMRVFILGVIPQRTFQRRVQLDQPLQVSEADAIARLLRVTAFANKVLGDEERATRWLTKPNPSLNNKIPLDMAETDVGAREVEIVLKRIAYGDYS